MKVKSRVDYLSRTRNFFILVQKFTFKRSKWLEKETVISSFPSIIVFSTLYLRNPNDRNYHWKSYFHDNYHYWKKERHPFLHFYRLLYFKLPIIIGKKKTLISSFPSIIQTLNYHWKKDRHPFFRFHRLLYFKLPIIIGKKRDAYFFISIDYYISKSPFKKSE